MTQRNTTTRDKHRRTIARDQPPCHWCKQPINYEAHHHDPFAFQIDHVTPLNKGGDDALDNLVPAHRRPSLQPRQVRQACLPTRRDIRDRPKLVKSP